MWLGAPLWGSPQDSPAGPCAAPVRAHWAWVFSVGGFWSIQHMSPGLDAEVRMSLGVGWSPGLSPVHKASSWKEGALKDQREAYCNRGGQGQRAQTRSVCKQSKFYSAAMSQELVGGRVGWGAVSCHPLSSGVFEYQAQGWMQESLGPLVC